MARVFPKIVDMCQKVRSGWVYMRHEHSLEEEHQHPLHLIASLYIFSFAFSNSLSFVLSTHFLFNSTQQ